jgi:hypothetical protein
MQRLDELRNQILQVLLPSGAKRVALFGLVAQRGLVMLYGK